MKDIKFVYKKKKYDDSFEGIVNSIAALYGEPCETLGFKFSYKGQKYGKVICGTKLNPLRDEHVIMMLEVVIKQMKRLKIRGE